MPFVGPFAESSILNPYEPPIDDSRNPPGIESSNRRPWFLPQLLLIAAIGSFLGSQFISPFVHSFGDPQGASTGIAIGGFIAIFIFFRWHRYRLSIVARQPHASDIASRDRRSMRSLVVVTFGLLSVVVGARTLYTAATAINQNILHCLPAGRRMSFGFDGLSVVANAVLFVVSGIVVTSIGVLCLRAFNQRSQLFVQYSEQGREPERPMTRVLNQSILLQPGYGCRSVTQRLDAE